MKSFKRYLSLFLCLPLLFAVFSISVSAETVDTSGYKVNIHAYEESFFNFDYGEIDLVNGEAKNAGIGKTDYWIDNGNWIFKQRLTFTSTENKPIFESGKTYNFKAVNLLFRILFEDDKDNTLWNVFKPTQVFEAYVVYSDDSTENVTVNLTYYEKTKTYGISCDLDPTKDVVRFVVTVGLGFPTSSIPIPDRGINYEVIFFYGTWLDGPLGLDISVQSEEAGLLTGILGKLSNIFDGITDGFNNLIKGITELPQRLWSLIENGLKNLFVPDDEYMASYSDKWDQLLESRLGAVYQVCDIVVNSWDGIMNADQTKTINLPLVCIPLGDTSFSFGGTDVNIVPDGFDGIVVTLKVIVGIVCTALFINGLLKRYDEVMGVEK